MKEMIFILQPILGVLAACTSVIGFCTLIKAACRRRMKITADIKTRH